MEKIYRVKWEKKADPSITGGSLVSVSKDVAQAWVDQMNHKYPELNHFAVVDLDPADPELGRKVKYALLGKS